MKAGARTVGHKSEVRRDQRESGACRSRPKRRKSKRKSKRRSKARRTMGNGGRKNKSKITNLKGEKLIDVEKLQMECGDIESRIHEATLNISVADKGGKIGHISG